MDITYENGTVVDARSGVRAVDLGLTPERRIALFAADFPDVDMLAALANVRVGSETLANAVALMLGKTLITQGEANLMNGS